MFATTVACQNVNNSKSIDPVKKLPGTHPGFGKLPSKLGVYRAQLRPYKKRRPEHSDFKGVLHVSNGRALVNVRIHSDGSLGLRLEKIAEPKK
jgi:hypothetical protein